MGADGNVLGETPVAKTPVWGQGVWHLKINDEAEKTGRWDSNTYIFNDAYGAILREEGAITNYHDNGSESVDINKSEEQIISIGWYDGGPGNDTLKIWWTAS